MGGGASSLPEETQAALSEETRAAIEGLSEEAQREIVTIAGMMELAPAAVEASTPQATAPVVDEKNAVLVAAGLPKLGAQLRRDFAPARVEAQLQRPELPVLHVHVVSQNLRLYQRVYSQLDSIEAIHHLQ